MVWLILAGVAGGLLLMAWLISQMGFLGALLGLLSIPLILGAIVTIGERRDRNRQRSLRDPASHFDPNRPNNYGNPQRWDVPTAYIDHPSGAGTPPGIDEDDRPPRR